MDSKLSRWCDGLIEAGWLAAIIATPLFFNIHSDRVFEPDKLTLLRSIAVIMLAAWLVKFVDQKGWQQRPPLSWRNQQSIWKMPFVLPVVVLVLIYLASTLFSVTPSVSWAGSYQRLQGTYTTLSYIVIFGVTIMTMRTRAQVRRVVTAVIITSIPVAFYGLLQHFQLDPLPWGGNTTKRVAGHMGNAIFIAAYLIMAVPLTVARIVASFNNILNDDDLATADVIRSSVYIFTLAIQLITIYWSGSRGPWLGIGVGMFAFILILLVSLRNADPDRRRFNPKDAGKALLLVIVGAVAAFVIVSVLLNLVTGTGRLASLAGPMGSFVAFVVAIGVVMLVIFVMLAAQRGWRWLWLSWILLSLVLGVWIVTFNLPQELTQPYEDTPVVGDAFSTLDEWRSLPLVGRFGTILESESGTGKVRVLIWEGTIELLRPHEPLKFPNGKIDTFNFLRPLIGYGPESMYVAYNRFYPPELATIEARNASPDRSHNETFDALVITGWLGFVTWQILYLSVFYYGFRWLGVLRTKFERNLLIGLWVGAGLLTTAVFVVWRGTIFFGVAFPFGTIGGLILYLIYYALFAKPPEEEIRPFRWDRLLVTALIAGIVAHYVEIHFGIAIAATRIHFFMYLGLLFVITYLMPQEETKTAVEPEPTPSKKRKRRRTARPTPTPSYGTWGPLLLNAFMLALIIGTMGFTYITFTQPPDLASVDELTAGTIFKQSFFVNAQKDFADSPFIFLMLILTWVLGILVMISEMVKDGDLRFTAAAKTLDANRQKIIAAIFAVMGVVSILYRILIPLSEGTGATALLGQSLFWIWGFLCLWAAYRVFRGEPAQGQLSGAAVALAGVVFTLPLLIAGGGIGAIVIGLVCAALLYFLWDSTWNNSLGAAGALALVSLSFSLAYAFFQASQLRFSLLYGYFVPAPQDPALLTDYLVQEAANTAGLLVYYYLFVVLLMVLSAFAVSMSRKPSIRQAGTTPAYALLAALVIVSGAVVYLTNAQVIQADIIYKRGRFYDNQAPRNGDVNLWKNAIAIYEGALEQTPREDFYYLFLGRAYLELATLTTDVAEAEVLLDEAETRLKDAQKINPLNTDHTANLARLNTRWIGLSQTEAEREERIQDAESYYLDALALSPQNSMIRNEYARLLLGVKNDCDGALGIYQESVEIDPYYDETYLSYADALIFCMAEESEETKDEMYAQAADLLQQGLVENERNAHAWFRLGQLQQDFGKYDEALAAYDEVRERDTRERVLPAWQLDLLVAQLLLEKGEPDKAEAMAKQALAAAPAEAQGQIDLFIQQINGDNASDALESEPLPEMVAGFDLDGERPLADLSLAERVNHYNAYPPFVIDPVQEYEAIITTQNGPIRIRLFSAASPLTVNNFVYLAAQGFYDGTTFHRVIADFMAQAGDPSATGTGGPGYVFQDEVNNGLSFDRPGLLAMANAGPGTNGSQFFITYVPTPHLDGLHTIFGEVLSGQEALNEITLHDPSANSSGDVIERIDIVEAGE
ncbi:MAG: tetratricopeptide repeat protein [Chloroflexi bacterium]|nr:tetratricopeptide repeat protein [Chloroflexota bacterium]